MGHRVLGGVPCRLQSENCRACLPGDIPPLADFALGLLGLLDLGVDERQELGAERFDERLLPWLDGPPQTNEAGRSASIVAALLWLAERTGKRMELLEIGSSAGVNTMLERYRFDLGGAQIGPSDSPMHIAPDWRGPPPPPG